MSSTHGEPTVPAVAAPWLGPGVARLGAALLAERQRWILWLPVGVGVGAAIYFALTTEPTLWLGAAWLAAAASLGVLTRRRPTALLLAVALTTGAAGFTVAQWRTHMVAAPVLEKRVEPATIEGRVLRVEARPDSERLLLDRVRIDRVDEAATPRRIRLTNRPHLPRRPHLGSSSGNAAALANRTRRL